MFAYELLVPLVETPMRDDDAEDEEDSGEIRPVAERVNAFLDRITDEPARFLWELGCTVRFGKGRSQFIPRRYFSEVRPLSE